MSFDFYWISVRIFSFQDIEAFCQKNKIVMVKMMRYMILWDIVAFPQRYKMVIRGKTRCGVRTGWKELGAHTHKSRFHLTLQYLDCPMSTSLYKCNQFRTPLSLFVGLDILQINSLGKSNPYFCTLDSFQMWTWSPCSICQVHHWPMCELSKVFCSFESFNPLHNQCMDKSLRLECEFSNCNVRTEEYNDFTCMSINLSASNWC